MTIDAGVPLQATTRGRGGQGAVGPGSALVVGEALVDVLHGAYGSLRERPGGSPANVAVGLARLGHPVTLATRLGTDRRGARLAAHFRGEGIELLAQRGPRTSTAHARLRADGNASYVFDLDWDVAPDPPATRPVVVHTGSFGAVLPPGAQHVAELIRGLAPATTVTYDLNLRPAAMGADEGLRTRVERIVRLADVVTTSDEDLAHLLPGLAPAQAAERLLGLGPSAVVVTLGARGSLCVTPGAVVAAAAQRVEVVDTIGAGDAFCAGVIDRLWCLGLLGSARREALRSLDDGGWFDVLTQASVVAGLTVGREGADPPTRAELDATLAMSAGGEI
ncbi:MULTISPECIES: PfkB family carbohydrate kinase [unclassified Pseudofrankia]|uniref:PfkB family carbohydrate kinase n=1 Tax=unclassified Pseudofrankia TaxID=2994372 RepID=UPI0009F2A4FE|nr:MULTISPECIES: PfkB family carbohydrate kinase [unclassified Pseudofrankia]MDT3441169.1 PfkB family carbohydrate kinase [Pseudofrankia sp. BMG5.37]